ncbi:MAG: DUF6542 domain-containing protein [Streptosporangiaceae bacterium]
MSGATRERLRPPRADQQRAAAIALTAPGGVAAIVVPTLFGTLVDGLWHGGIGAATGVGFVIGCAFAAVKTRRRDLATIAITPPMLFACVVVVAETFAWWGSGNWIRHEVLALTTALATDAPWLLLGTLAAVVIGLPRGLIGSVRQLIRR